MSESTPTPAETDTAPAEPVRSSATVTSLNRKWVIKMAAIILVLDLFGLWALYDALWAYPKRGANASEYLEYQLLDLLAKNKSNSDPSIPDPAQRLTQLKKQLNETGKLDEADGLRVRWLESLQLISHLNANATSIPRDDFRGAKVTTAAERLDTLTKKWTRDQGKVDPPKPLSAFDIPSQWAILAICWSISGWVAVTLAASAGKKFRWNEATQTLTLPGGATLIPSQIAEFDKRKWHKFYIALHVKPDHPTLGGKTLEFDLLRYEPLEQWVLDMEKTAFPESAQDSTQPQPVPAQ
ncbi:MAG: hypothetical protein JSR77_03425 [Planctomycetes bacterium]|nr:hypothetical protein [Planctomycetota bacterium]